MLTLLPQSEKIRLCIDTGTAKQFCFKMDCFTAKTSIYKDAFLFIYHIELDAQMIFAIHPLRKK